MKHLLRAMNVALGLVLAGAACALPATAQGFKQAEDPWFRAGQAALERAKQRKPILGPARNLILFVGDGMGIATVTAARILEGQNRGRSGEENLLSFETLPHVALSKTYNTNQQTPDSAGTMSAIMTGVKTKAGLIALTDKPPRGECIGSLGNEATTALELAEMAGISTGVVTTAHLTHATPAATYAHGPERDWEDDNDMPSEAIDAGCRDIARQLIEFPFGDGLEVALGGGRLSFLPAAAADPEDEGETGERQDGRDLTEEWVNGRPNAAYVWNKAQFEAVDANEIGHLLGLFNGSHMQYEVERAEDKGGEPSLSEMTGKAIEFLSGNERGYFLMVEGARIDHASHDGNAYRALYETIEFSNAVGVAMERTDADDTLIIVTADHGQALAMTGYPTRGNPILGKVIENDEQGRSEGALAEDLNDLPFTTLSFVGGPGHREDGRPDLRDIDTTAVDYLQEALVPLEMANHSGEDVAIYARGPGAYLLHGVVEQNYIFHVMDEALRLRERANGTEGLEHSGSSRRE